MSIAIAIFLINRVYASACLWIDGGLLATASSPRLLSLVVDAYYDDSRSSQQDQYYEKDQGDVWLCAFVSSLIYYFGSIRHISTIVCNRLIITNSRTEWRLNRITRVKALVWGLDCQVDFSWVFDKHFFSIDKLLLVKRLLKSDTFLPSDDIHFCAFWDLYRFQNHCILINDAIWP